MWPAALKIFSNSLFRQQCPTLRSRSAACRSVGRLGHSNDVGSGNHCIGLADPFSQLPIEFVDQFRNTANADERQEKHEKPVDVEEIDVLHIGHQGRQASEQIDDLNESVRTHADQVDEGNGQELKNHATILTPLTVLTEKETLLIENAKDETHREQGNEQCWYPTMNEEIVEREKRMIGEAWRTTQRLAEVEFRLTRIGKDQDGVEEKKIENNECQRKVMHEETSSSIAEEMTVENEKMPFERSPEHEHVRLSEQKVITPLPDETSHGTLGSDHTHEQVMQDKRNLDEISEQSDE
jgi:hypothetical protein